MSGDSRRRDRGLLVGAGFFLTLTIAAGVLAADDPKDGLDHLEGTVVETWIHYVDDTRDYESRILVRVDGEVVRFVSNHGTSETAVGDAVDVWYDPSRPGEDTFVTDEDLRWSRVGSFLPVVFGTVLGFALLVRWWRSNQAAKRERTR